MQQCAGDGLGSRGVEHTRCDLSRTGSGLDSTDSSILFFSLARVMKRGIMPWPAAGVRDSIQTIWRSECVSLNCSNNARTTPGLDKGETGRRSSHMNMNASQ